jgi:hypothetical protein
MGRSVDEVALSIADRRMARLDPVNDRQDAD